MADLGKRLKQKREALGLTLSEAAQLSGIGSLQTISKIEHGKREVKANELAALAKAYAFDVNLFLLRESPGEKIQIYLRAEKKTSKAKQIKAKSKMFFERYFHLQNLLGYETTGTKLSLITRQIASVFDASDEGEKYWNLLKLGDRPALTFRRILEEEYNLPIFFFEMPKGTSAISIISSTYAAICVNTQDVPWRRNFDIAHELFHILYQQSIPEECGASNDKTQEMFANAFASAFLLPRASLEKEIEKRKEKSKLNITDLIVMACEYDVSVDALLWRLVNLGRINRAKVEKILSVEAVKDYYKSLRKPKIDKIPYISDKYICMIFDAFTQGIMSEMSAAEYLNVSVGETNNIFAEAGLIWEGESDIEITV